MGDGVCRSCRGSRTQHGGDPDGCWCPRCLDSENRCRDFDPVKTPEQSGQLKRPHGRPEALTGKDDGVTQRQGAALAKLKSGTRRWEAYQAIRAAGWYGVTFDELCATLGRTYSQTGPRVRELVADGLVVKADYRRLGTSGADQEVWISVSTGGEKP
jgi:hypothetical protein